MSRQTKALAAFHAAEKALMAAVRACKHAEVRQVFRPNDFPGASVSIYCKSCGACMGGFMSSVLRKRLTKKELAKYANRRSIGESMKP